MIENYYNLYVQSILNFAETIVIKSDAVADSVNLLIRTIYGDTTVDPYNKTTWKYYQNICGIYHFSDDPIMITSIDTLQTIRFTSDNLKIHRATGKAYQYGTRNYNELVSIYPDKETLILGVLYPAKMDYSVNAVDGTVLSYPPLLVESNEVSLIKNIEAWVFAFKSRWYNEQFGVSDSLYVTTHLAQMYLSLVPAIINLRLRACKTNEAHSFHVRQYLASHGMLDFYLDDMSIKQALFFYRNITYIERNNGKQFVFKWLVEKVMTDRALPLGELVMKHNLLQMPEVLRPVAGFKKKPLNKTYNINPKREYNLTEIFDKDEFVVPGNADYIADKKRSIDLKLQNSLSSVVATKLLDSSLIDYTGATPYTFEDIAINHWLSFSTNGYYNTFVLIKNPRSGKQISIQCKDAFTYFLYCFDRALGSNIAVIPLLFAQRVIRQPKPSVDDLFSVVDKKLITKEDAQNVLNLQPFISKSISVEDFLSTTKALFKSAQQQIRYVASKQDEYARGLMQSMVMRMYCNKFCRVEPDGTLYKDWLIQKNLPTEEFTTQEYLDIYKQLYEAVVGTDLDSSAKITKLQTAMLGLLAQLSSYSIKFTREVIGSNLISLNLNYAQLGNKKLLGKQHVIMNDLQSDIIDQGNSSSQGVVVIANAPGVTFDNKNVGYQGVKIDIDVKVFLPKNAFEQKQRVNIGTLLVGTMWTNPARNIKNDTGFIGYNDPEVLANTQIGFFKDVYDNCFEYPVDRRIDITSTFSVDAFTLFGGSTELSDFKSNLGTFQFKEFKLAGSTLSIDQFKLSGDTNAIVAK